MKTEFQRIGLIRILTPIEMCIYILQNNLENTFRIYLFLKLNYNDGKIKFTKNEINILADSLNVTSRTIRSQIKKIVELGWVQINTKTQYYILTSFDKIRVNNGWVTRASIDISIQDIQCIRAILGAALYVYLHKDFWRKVKREKSVLIKGNTYHFLSPSFNFKNHFAPVSLIGVQKIFGISQAKASRLKQLAYNAGYIKVKKKFKKIDLSKEDVSYIKKYDVNHARNIIFKNRSYYWQQIDHIRPFINIRKRKKLET
jgi:hypothetical protein